MSLSVLLGIVTPCVASLPSCLPPVEIAAAKISRVEQNGVLVLADGRAVKIEGLLLPAGSKDHAPQFLHQQAVAELDDLTRGREVRLLARPAKEDRYGRIRAQVIFPDDDSEPWLQAAMLRRGLARVSISPDREECAKELYAAEAEARGKRAGIWASSSYAIRTPESIAPADLGTFQVVQGRVINSAVRGGRGYLNFGRDWRTDFSVTISPDDMKIFRAAVVDPQNYAGLTVRVRGWIDRMNGFEIEAAGPASIEVVGKTSGLGESGHQTRPGKGPSLSN